MEPSGDFTAGLWKSVERIYIELIRHPFVSQLAQGTLPHHCFAHYLSQDILYIREDSIALEKLSKKAPTPSEQDFFKALASDGISLEQELHNYYLRYFKIEEAKIKSSVIDKYTRFLNTHTDKSSYPIAAAALLPCFWIYNKVGNHIFMHSAKNNVYHKWIDTYQGAAYEEYLKKFIQIVEQIAVVASEYEKEMMREVFIKGAEFELSFFDEAIAKQ